MIRVTILGCWLLIIALSLVGCGSHQATLLGKPPAPNGAVASGVSTISTVQHAKLAQPVKLAGTMTEKCPVAGCWFYVIDKTGKIKVDTKDAGFTVTEVPLQSEVTVVGKVATEGSERKIEATSVSY